MESCNGNLAGINHDHLDPLRDNISAREAEKTLLGESEKFSSRKKSLLKRLRPAIFVLQLFGYFPGSTKERFLSNWLLKFYWLVLFGIHVYIIKISLTVTASYYEYFGTWHVFTVSSIINGLKPIINAMCFLSFGFFIKRHRRLLIELCKIDNEFSKDLGYAPNIKFRTLCFVCGTIGILVAVLAMRLVEFVMNQEQLGEMFLADISLILVPLISTWNALPLLYFLFIENIVIHWVKRLRKSLTSARISLEVNNCNNMEHAFQSHSRPEATNSTQVVNRRFSASTSNGSLRIHNTHYSNIPDDITTEINLIPSCRHHHPRSLKFYYRKFLDLTELEHAVGNFFGPWVLASLGWSLFTLCLTIYFLTNPVNVYELPKEMLESMTPAEVEQSRLILLFNIFWSVLQISLAFLHIIIICSCGTSLNEQTRLIMRPVFQLVSEDISHEDRFTVSCFVYKMQTQYYWGATVWKAFPIERGVFFTIGSLIVTYAVLLLRFNNKAIETGGMGADMVPGNSTIPAINVTARF